VKILILGINYSPETVGTGRYTGEMARWLARAGDEVRVVAAAPYYPHWRVFDGYSNRWYSSSHEDNVRVTRCPLYIPRVTGLVKRLLHLSSFALSATIPMLRLIRWQPDIVLLVAPTMLCGPLALLTAMLSGAVPVLHVQDFEVDAMVGAGIGEEGFAVRCARACESFLLRRFSLVSTISAGMDRRARAKGLAEGRSALLPNWADMPMLAQARQDPELLIRLGMDPDRPVVLYSGNIGKKQGLETVLEAAADVRLQNCLFLICGDGAGKADLIARTEALGLGNVFFGALLPDAQFANLLVSVDCHLVIQKAGVADAVLPSKLTNILAAGGNAVVTAQAQTSLGALCAEHAGIAVCVQPESADALVRGITEALALPRPNKVARTFAATSLAIDPLMGEYRMRLLNLCSR